jgi:hypothetical protein
LSGPKLKAPGFAGGYLLFESSVGGCFRRTDGKKNPRALREEPEAETSSCFVRSGISASSLRARSIRAAPPCAKRQPFSRGTTARSRTSCRTHWLRGCSSSDTSRAVSPHAPSPWPSDLRLSAPFPVRLRELQSGRLISAIRNLLSFSDYRRFFLGWRPAPNSCVEKIPSAYVTWSGRVCTAQTADYVRRCPFSLAACAA